MFCSRALAASTKQDFPPEHEAVRYRLPPSVVEAVLRQCMKRHWWRVMSRDLDVMMTHAAETKARLDGQTLHQMIKVCVQCTKTVGNDL